MTHTIQSLLPPLLVLVLGITTHRVLLSLTAGLISAAFIASNWDMYGAFYLTVTSLWKTTELSSLTSWHTFSQSHTPLIFFFLTNLGILVRLLQVSGGAAAYTYFVKQNLSSSIHTERASLFLSLFLFIDDYFSALTVGTIMKPLTDLYKIPRVKLAFLVDSFAAPLAIIIPLSSWVAVVIGQLEKAGIHHTAEKTTSLLADPYIVYLHTIPFIFYSLCIIASAWFIISKRISFGKMKKHEDMAVTSGNVFGGQTPPHHEQPIAYQPDTHSIYDFIVPVASFLLSIAGSILYTGGYPSTSLLQAIQQAQSSQALALGSFISVLFSFVFLIIRNSLPQYSYACLFYEGFSLMGSSMLVLLLSWSLGGLLQHHLKTGSYLASLLIGNLPLALLPVMFFFAASLISLSMGSSWGTVAIAIPIAIPLLLSLLSIEGTISAFSLPLLFPTLGGILSGAVFGDHISPISDTTIMTSTSTGCNHMDHVTTQFEYTFPVFLGTALSYLVAGYTITYGVFICTLLSASSGITLSCFLLRLFHHQKDVRNGKI